MMRCGNCFHNCVCGSSSPYNDASTCKQYIYNADVLCGTALRVVLDDYEGMIASNRQLNEALKNCELRQLSLEKEVQLLRIIKQTLEMQSGMKFDF